MNKLRTFWATFKKSTTSFEYYKDVLKAPFSYSLKYLAFLLFLTSLIGSIFLAFGILKLIPKIPQFEKDFKSAAEKVYPDELVLTFQDSELSTNVEEPYFIPIPSEAAHYGVETGENAPNLIAIDTNASFDDYNDYNSLILVTKNGVIIPDNDNRKVYFFKEMDGLEDKEITKEIYQEGADKVTPYLKFLRPLAVILIILAISVLPLIIAGFSLVWKMFTLLFNAFFVWIMANLRSRDITYKEAYRLSMHGITINIILSTIVSLVGGIFALGVLEAIIFLVFMYKVLSKLPKTSAKGVSR